MKTIYLCGFMGCGKSTVGRILAKKLGAEFYDLDSYIEKKAGMRISEIFEKHGEEHFRSLESQAIEEFQKKKGVVATGGGAMLSEKNAQTANKNGIVVFIDTAFEICYDRIKGDESRPIAFNSTEDELFDRYDARYPLYKKHSTFTVDGNGTPLQIAQEIFERAKIYKG